MADSLILATARAFNATLWTQDADFKGLGLSAIARSAADLQCPRFDQAQSNVVVLDSEVAAVFPNFAAVNKALHSLVEVAGKVVQIEPGRMSRHTSEGRYPVDNASPPAAGIRIQTGPRLRRATSVDTVYEPKH
jgi:hypothetical protein